MQVAGAVFLLASGFSRAFTSPPPALGQATCLEGWIDASSVNMGCILLDSSPYTWDAANNRCQNLAGTLVEISNEAQLEFLMFQLQFLEGLGGTKWWWTSGTDAGVNGVWKWATSSSPVGDFVWSWGFPNADRYNCLVLAPSIYYKGLNYDCAGSDNNEYPICQMR